MKKLLAISPLIVTLAIIIAFLCVFSMGVFDKPEETEITTITLKEIIEKSDLTLAKYIQNGIVTIKSGGKEPVLVLYYANVKLKIDTSKLKYNIDHDTKTVTILSEPFSYDAELLSEQDGYKFYYYPKNTTELNAKEVRSACKMDAVQDAQKNIEFSKRAKESFRETIWLLFKPLLEPQGYTVEFNINEAEV